MMQGMRSISSRDFQSSIFTVTEDSRSKNPKSGRKSSGHRLLLTLLTSPTQVQLPCLPLDLSSSYLSKNVFLSAFRCLVHSRCSRNAN